MSIFRDERQSDAAYADSWARLHAALDQGGGVEEGAHAAADFPGLVQARISALQQAMSALGLTVIDLDENSGKLVGVTEKFVKLTFADRTGREVAIEILRNGNAFLAGRRYEEQLSRVSLSDAEITRNNILRVAINREEKAVIVTFLTFDGRPSHLRIDAAPPYDPQLVGNIPASTLTMLKSRPETASLAEKARQAIAATERNGSGKGFFKTLFNDKAQQARGDVEVLQAYCASASAIADEVNNWSQRPEVMGPVADAIVRRLTCETGVPPTIVIHAMVTVGIGRLLASMAATPTG